MSIEQNQERRLRVVVADDNKEMRDTVTRLLEDGFDVVGAVADGRALLAAVDKLKPDVAVIDISMPVMNGIEAAEEIKKRGSNMKVIFLTVNEDADFVRAAFEVGGVGYVVKRQMATDLQVAIERARAGETFISPSCSISGTSFLP